MQSTENIFSNIAKDTEDHDSLTDLDGRVIAKAAGKRLEIMNQPLLLEEFEAAIKNALFERYIYDEVTKLEQNNWKADFFACFNCNLPDYCDGTSETRNSLFEFFYKNPSTIPKDFIVKGKTRVDEEDAADLSQHGVTDFVSMLGLGAKNSKRKLFDSVRSFHEFLCD